MLCDNVIVEGGCNISNFRFYIIIIASIQLTVAMLAVYKSTDCMEVSSLYKQCKEVNNQLVTHTPLLQTVLLEMLPHLLTLLALLILKD